MSYLYFIWFLVSKTNICGLLFHFLNLHITFSIEISLCLDYFLLDRDEVQFPVFSPYEFPCIHKIHKKHA